MVVNLLVRIAVMGAFIPGLAPCFAQMAKSPMELRQEALALQQQGKIPEAETAWRAYLKDHPDNPEPYAQIGVLEAHQGRYKEAIPLYRKALAISPRDPHVPAIRLNLGLALFKDGQPKDAISEFAELLKTAPPGSADAQRLNILIGMAHYGLGQYADAVPYLRTAAVHDPSSLPLRLTLGHSCLWTKQYKCVMDVYREILNLNAESAEADMLAGEALDAMKDNAGSTKMFRAAAAANPKEPNVHFGLGYLLWTQKQYPEAAQQFRAELANNPAHAQSMLYLGDSELQLNHEDEARPWLEKAVKLDPSLGLGDLRSGHRRLRCRTQGRSLARTGDRREAGARQCRRALAAGAALSRHGPHGPGPGRICQRQQAQQAGRRDSLSADSQRPQAPGAAEKPSRTLRQFCPDGGSFHSAESVRLGL